MKISLLKHHTCSQPHKTEKKGLKPRSCTAPERSWALWHCRGRTRTSSFWSRSCSSFASSSTVFILLEGWAFISKPSSRTITSYASG